MDPANFFAGEDFRHIAGALLEHPLPWTKMRQIYRLLGLVRRHCAELVGQVTTRPRSVGTASRFIRDSKDFTVGRLS